MMVSLLVLPVVRVRVSLKLLQLPRALHSTNRELLQCNTRKLEFLSASLTFSFSAQPAAPEARPSLPVPSICITHSLLQSPLPLSSLSTLTGCWSGRPGGSSRCRGGSFLFVDVFELSALLPLAILVNAAFAGTATDPTLTASALQTLAPTPTPPFTVLANVLISNSGFLTLATFSTSCVVTVTLQSDLLNHLC